MSIVSQLDPSGKEIEIGGKKYTQDSKITFNMKAFISLVIIIGTMFGTTYYFMNARLDKNEAKYEDSFGKVTNQINQMKDENLMELKEKVDATNGKMELLMLLINSNQIDLNEINNNSSATVSQEIDSSATRRLPNLNNLNTE